MADAKLLKLRGKKMVEQIDEIKNFRVKIGNNSKPLQLDVKMQKKKDSAELSWVAVPTGRIIKSYDDFTEADFKKGIMIDQKSLNYNFAGVKKNNQSLKAMEKLATEEAVNLDVPIMKLRSLDGGVFTNATMTLTAMANLQFCNIEDFAASKDLFTALLWEKKTKNVANDPLE